MIPTKSALIRVRRRAYVEAAVDITFGIVISLGLYWLAVLAAPVLAEWLR